MSRRDRHDSDRRGERRDSQPDDEQQRRSGDAETQESDSLTALKAILAKVASLLNPLKLTQEESIRLVEQLYGSVLETDVRLAGEADDARKSSVLAHIQNTSITRVGDKLVVEFPSAKDPTDAEQSPPDPAQSDPVGTEAPAAQRTKAPASRPAPAGAAPRKMPVSPEPTADTAQADTAQTEMPPAGAAALEVPEASQDGPPALED